VYGLSPDDVDSHCRFAEKNQLNFPLLADVDRKLIDALGAYGEKESDGRKFMGILRTTLIIGPDGRVEKLWEKVKFKDHAEEVLQAVKANTASAGVLK
jgi:peroxiredoxin Q/BCP